LRAAVSMTSHLVVVPCSLVLVGRFGAKLKLDLC